MRMIYIAAYVCLFNALNSGIANASCWMNCSPQEIFHDKAETFKGYMGNLADDTADFSSKIDKFSDEVNKNNPSNVTELQKRVRKIKADISDIQEKLKDGGKLYSSYTDLLTESKKWRAKAQEMQNVSEEMRRTVISQWDTKISKISAAGVEIDTLRKEISRSLSIVSGQENLLEQFAALQAVDDAIKALSSFIADMKAFSNTLKNAINAGQNVPTS